jgi:hypothetical protein
MNHLEQKLKKNAIMSTTMEPFVLIIKRSSLRFVTVSINKILKSFSNHRQDRIFSSKISNFFVGEKNTM